MTLDLIDHLLIDYHLFFFASLGAEAYFSRNLVRQSKGWRGTVSRGAAGSPVAISIATKASSGPISALQSSHCCVSNIVVQLLRSGRTRGSGSTAIVRLVTFEAVSCRDERAVHHRDSVRGKFDRPNLLLDSIWGFLPAILFCKPGK
jgi:hypothetical protein